jgi:hypothetical protein
MFGFGNKVYVLPSAIYQINSGAFTFMFGGAGTGDGQFTNLTSMAFGPGPNGLFYCLDWVPAPGIPRVEVFDLTDPNGNYFRYSFNLPAGLATTSTTDLGFAINDVGHMFVGDGQGGGVEMDLNGNVICTFDPPADDVPDPNAYAGTGTFGIDGTLGGPGNGPGDASYIAFDAAGDIFVENNANGLHRYIDTQAVPPSNVAQTISAFPMIAIHTSTDAPFTITPPTSISRLPVTVKVFSGPATISGLTVTLTGVGTVVLAADQAGNSYYGAAPEVKVAFKVIAVKK